jgi:hypothetical protein
MQSKKVEPVLSYSKELLKSSATKDLSQDLRWIVN